MKRPVAPCLFCDEKHVGCHIDCEKYQDYVAAQKLFRESVAKQKTQENVLEELELKRYRK